MDTECKGCKYYFREDYDPYTYCHCDEYSDESESLPCERYDDGYELQHDKQKGI